MRAWLAGVLGLILLGCSSAPQADSISSSDSAVPRHVVDGFADRLMKFDDEAGFGRVQLHYDSNAVMLLWKGAPPAPVSQAIEDADPRITVSVKSVRYSASELIAAGERLIRASAGGRWNTQIVGAAPLADLSGLRVQAIKPSQLPKGDVEMIAGLPVRLVKGGPLTELSG